METDGDGECRICQLPAHLLHHILTLIPWKDAVRFSTLSRACLHAWKSIPVNTFKFTCDTAQPEVVLPSAHNFCKILSILQRKQPMPVNLHVSLPYSKNVIYESCMDNWFRVVTKHRVLELKIDLLPAKIEQVQEEDNDANGYDNSESEYEFSEELLLVRETYERSYTLSHEATFAAAESLVLLSLRGCKMITKYFDLLGPGRNIRPLLQFENRKLVSLRVLFCENSVLNDELLQEFLPLCPSLEECTLISVLQVPESCIEISNFRKLKQLKLVGFECIDIENNPSLQVVDISNFWFISGAICDGIRDLTLKICDRSNNGGWSYSLYKLPSPKSLALNIGDVWKLSIGSSCLETFRFCPAMCSPKSIEVYAPMLQCFDFQGSMLPEISFEIPWLLRRIELVLMPQKHYDDTYSFCKDLRTNLEKIAGYNSFLKLTINAKEFAPMEIPLDEWYRPSPAFIDSVELQEDIWSPLVLISLVKWLFWCCRPLHLSACPSYTFIKVFQNIVLQMLKDTEPCPRLAGVKVDTPHGSKDFTKSDIVELPFGEILQFRLEWH